MRYTVVWEDPALNELAQIWNSSSDQQAVADAADDIDRLLRRSPERYGVDGGNGERYLEVPPLAVVFTIQPDDRQVRVLEVWRLL